MSNQPVKLLIATGIVAVLVASVMSRSVEGKFASTPSNSVKQSGLTKQERAVSRSWFSGWFDGMSFKTGSSNKSPSPKPLLVKPAAATGFGAITIAADHNGQYNTIAEIEGQRIAMLVDTGASVIALRHEDALRLGVSPMPSDFTVRISTANGEIRAARTTLRAVRIENMTVRDVSAVVMPQGALSKSLLGMSFLRKLSRFEIASGNLILRP